MKIILMALAITILSGCTESMEADRVVRDQCLRREIFKECMSLLPKGPTVIGTSNDWDEVVSACESVAAYQALRKNKFIKPECAI